MFECHRDRDDGRGLTPKCLELELEGRGEEYICGVGLCSGGRLVCCVKCEVFLREYARVVTIAWRERACCSLCSHISEERTQKVAVYYMDMCAKSKYVIRM